MGAMGRGKCIKLVMFISFFLIGLLISGGVHASTTHIVGGSQGWGLSVSYTDWVAESSFAAGDTLVFNYPAGAHDVIHVSALGYRRCQASARELAKVATTGNDKFTLKKGANYFICSYEGHCSACLKIKVNVN
ncbi:Plastocyanin-like [Macleaya cordata]|uniref:Plastocyanin-like n=1 Tax=Macleaya cordata TaxID=56857 RepID=A0A200PVW4_MACCD|nr:Plastocyanin-like [Macleaya cordata]